MSQFTITIPRIPAGPNSKGGLLRSHYHARTKQCNMWHQEILAALGDARIFHRIRRTRAHVHIHQFRRRRLDPDNLVASCKFILDALRASGLIVDDSEEWIELQVTQDTVPAATVCTKITIRDV